MPTEGIITKLENTQNSTLALFSSLNITNVVNKVWINFELFFDNVEKIVFDIALNQDFVLPGDRGSSGKLVGKKL